MHGCERATRYLMPAFWLPAQAVEQEEKNTDKILTGIAKSVVNVEAEEDETEET